MPKWWSYNVRRSVLLADLGSCCYITSCCWDNYSIVCCRRDGVSSTAKRSSSHLVQAVCSSDKLVSRKEVETVPRFGCRWVGIWVPERWAVPKQPTAKGIRALLAMSRGFSENANTHGKERETSLIDHALQEGRDTPRRCFQMLTRCIEDRIVESERLLSKERLENYHAFQRPSGRAST